MVIKLLRPTRRLVVGHVASAKSNTLLKWRGIAERALFQMLDVDPEVTEIKPRSNARDSFGEIIHTFPASVRCQGQQSFFVEIVREGALSPKLARICRQMARSKLVFKLYDRDVLLSSEVSSNVTRLRRVRRCSPSSTLVGQLADFQGAWPASIADLAEYIGRERDVDKLIVHGYLKVDLLRPLAGDSLVDRLH